MLFQTKEHKTITNTITKQKITRLSDEPYAAAFIYNNGDRVHRVLHGIYRY